MVIGLERGANVCFIKIQIGLTFPVPAYRRSGKEAVKCVSLFV